MTMIDFIKAKTTGEYSYVPYLAQFVNSLLNTEYGIFKGNVDVIIANSPGFVLNFLYHGVYWYYTDKHRRKMSVIFYAIAFVCCTGLTIGLIIAGADIAVDVLGVLMNISGIIQYASPLIKLKDVIKTKTSNGMSVPLTAGNTLCSSLWTLYGIFNSDVYLIIINGVSTVFGIIQIVIYIIYPKKGDLSTSPKPVQLADTNSDPNKSVSDNVTPNEAPIQHEVELSPQIERRSANNTEVAVVVN